MSEKTYRFVSDHAFVTARRARRHSVDRQFGTYAGDSWRFDTVTELAPGRASALQPYGIEV